MHDTDAICIYNMALTKNQQKKILSEMSASHVFTELDFTYSIVQLQNVSNAILLLLFTNSIDAKKDSIGTKNWLKHTK